MVYGFETTIPVEYEVTSQRKATFDLENNDQLLGTSLDLLEEAREIARMRMATYQKWVARYYNRRVRVRCYSVGDPMLCLVLLGARKANDETLGPNWEGPYIIKENLGNRAYHLANMDGVILP